MESTDNRLMFGYSRVSTDEQADSRNGLEAQRSAIDAEAARRGWMVEHHADEGASGKYINANLQEALQLLASGQGDGLIVAKLDRLARSVVHAANIINAAQAQGWSLVVLDINLDLSTAAGRMMARTLISFAEYERELISERTKAGLAAKKARGERIGRPRLATAGVVRRIVLDRNAGLSFGRIARALEAEAILSPAGQPTWQHVHRAPHLSECHGDKRTGSSFMKATYYPPNRGRGVLLRALPSPRNVHRKPFTSQSN